MGAEPGWSWIVWPAGASRKQFGINLGDELVGWMDLSTETAEALDAAITADATAVESRGYRRAISDLRDTESYGTWLIETGAAVPEAGWLRYAAFLESRLSAGPDMAQVVARERDANETPS